MNVRSAMLTVMSPSKRMASASASTSGSSALVVDLSSQAYPRGAYWRQIRGGGKSASARPAITAPLPALRRKGHHLRQLGSNQSRLPGVKGRVPGEGSFAEPNPTPTARSGGRPPNSPEPAGQCVTSQLPSQGDVDAMTSEPAHDTRPSADDVATPQDRGQRYVTLPTHRVRRTRIGGLWIGAALFALILLLLLIFILENGQRVSIGYFGAHGHLPLGVALLLAAVLGVLLVVIPGTGRIIQLRITARRHQRIDAQTATATPTPPTANSSSRSGPSA
jgi:uncharacterized integral membrane protein